MNNDTQNPVGPENSQLGPTRNPQTPGGQTLNSTGSTGVQNGTDIVTNSDGLSITSVGNSNSTKSVTLETSSQTPANIPPSTDSNPPYGIFAAVSLLIGIVFLATWLISRRDSKD